MATVKIVLRQKESKNGTFPLALRITKDRKTSFIHLGHSIREEDWDANQQRVKKSYPNSARLNNFLVKKLSEATDKSLELETHKSSVSSFAVKQKIKPTGGQTFFAQADLYLDNLKTAGKYNRYTADKPRVKHFKDFLKGNDISFSDVTIPLLERFQIYLKSTLSISERTIVNHLVVIRSIFSQAIKAEIIDQKYNPFGASKIRIQFPQSSKIGLDTKDIQALENLHLQENTFENHCRNLWLFSFYLAGMRVSDILRLKWTDIQNDRLHYVMGKNSKAGSLKIPEKALYIISQYSSERRFKDDYIFPDLKVLDSTTEPFIVQRKIAFTTSRIDKFLRNKVAPQAKIQKRLTMHIARHTFGNISGDKIPIQMLQKLYRHSSVLTTIGYQSNFVNKDVDEALESVINVSK